MDYLWAGLPVISTEGDYLSAMIDKKGLGIVTKTEMFRILLMLSLK